jgi:hypothetical protein
MKQGRLARQKVPAEVMPVSPADDKSEKMIEVNLSALPKDKRKPAWEWIQANQPGLATLLSMDENFRKLKETFNCSSVTVALPESACRELGLIR